MTSNFRNSLAIPRLLEFRLEVPYTGVPRPSGPEIPKRPQKVFPGFPALSVKEVSTFFDAPGRKAREQLIETLWRFRGSVAWRLLCMGDVIVILEEQARAEWPASRHRIASVFASWEGIAEDFRSENAHRQDFCIPSHRRFLFSTHRSHRIAPPHRAIWATLSKSSDPTPSA